MNMPACKPTKHFEDFVAIDGRADIFRKVHDLDMFLHEANPGYLEAARISGCKNISKIRRIDERTLEALDWRAVLKTKEDIGEDIHYVGIRAMNVRDVANGNLENAVPVRLLESVQTQFDIMEYCARTDDPGARLCRRYSKYLRNNGADVILCRISAVRCHQHYYHHYAYYW